MHSFRHSRGRIFFDVFCAFVISASCIGAWMQTGAWALLPAAAVAMLYGFVRASDLTGRNPNAAVDQPESRGSKDSLREVVAAQPAAPSQQLEPAIANAEAGPVEPAAPRKREASRAKPRRKAGARQTGAPDEAKITELAPPPAETEVALPMPPAEVAHLHIEPLFEAEPFVRMPRQAFGRKAG